MSTLTICQYVPDILKETFMQFNNQSPPMLKHLSYRLKKTYCSNLLKEINIFEGLHDI